jgi:hypothetical protein
MCTGEHRSEIRFHSPSRTTNSCGGPRKATFDVVTLACRTLPRDGEAKIDRHVQSLYKYCADGHVDV